MITADAAVQLIDAYVRADLRRCERPDPDPVLDEYLAVMGPIVDQIRDALRAQVARESGRLEHVDTGRSTY